MNRDMKKFDKERLSLQLYLYLKPMVKEIVRQAVDERLLSDVINKCLDDYFSVVKLNDITEKLTATRGWVGDFVGEIKYWNKPSNTVKLVEHKQVDYVIDKLKEIGVVAVKKDG